MRRPLLPVTLLLAAVLCAGCADDGGTLADAPASPSAPAATTETEAVVVKVGDDDGQDRREAALRTGQALQVDLHTCGGCGYQWLLDSPPDAAVLSGGQPEQVMPDAVPEPTGEPLVGTPTTTRFVFRGVAAGTAQLTLGYHGPGSTAPDRSVVVSVTVS